MKKYWCVFCEHCHPLIAIPLLEYDRTKQRQNPHDFQVTCHRCEATSAFDETELEVRKIERVPAFQSADGFRNVSRRPRSKALATAALPPMHLGSS